MKFSMECVLSRRTSRPLTESERGTVVSSSPRVLFLFTSDDHHFCLYYLVEVYFVSSSF